MPDFKKYFIIPAEPEEVYAGLTFKPTIELWTGSPAVFTPEAGTEFSLWDESIEGKNLEFEQGKMIRQQWYFGEASEDSIVTLKLHPHKKGTSLEVQHTNIPEEAYEDIVDGWHNVYMRDLIQFYTE
ncbi:SRPBCC domain-containing protein [Marinoscillum furvescens]|uniref:Activator of Hsp90 ATPase-like protein n=1 Tax=Marinoscillum furvescens DSM 4134 TaxID=1122208 RepID=A0A3D9L7U0_MARFU|nr:SRPBCC domain-containing protein [Marinoscillum furvescens]REE01191.1 activator of Hsp90 ATPase-like protein [Marinoscillum furvescens DSM 4134]